MHFAPDEATQRLQAQLEQFMDRHVYPAEPVLAEQVAADPDSWDPPPVIGQLQQAARDRGLWNLFLPIASERSSEASDAAGIAASERSSEASDAAGIAASERSSEA
ncbi:MAG: hypothetical protein ACRDT2_02655, partial [Natronosporangium sp.]